MAKVFNVNDYMFEEETGKWFHSQTGNYVRSKSTLQKLNEATGNKYVKTQKTVKTSGARASVINQAKRYSKYFSSGTTYVTKQGHLDNWAKSLSLKGGSNLNNNWSKREYKGFNGKPHKTYDKWGANVNQSSKSNGATILNGSKQWVRQLQISIYALRVQAANFRVMVGRRALKVFQNSFKYQHFYSQGAHRWAPLSPYTLKKRARRDTGSRILKEYGDLSESLKFYATDQYTNVKVYTQVVSANIKKHKKYSICYAGYHNEGKGTYGSAWNGHKPKPYIQRQFMGHSSYLNPLTDSFMRKMLKLYLFDSVFLAKQV